MTITWPPTLDDVKMDGEVPVDRDDDELQFLLDSAVAYVEAFHAQAYDFAGSFTLPPVPEVFNLGTIRQVLRWNARRRSPDALMQAGDASARVPSWDTDIELMLRMGRSRKGLLA